MRRGAGSGGRLVDPVLLLTLGAGWGLAQPLTRIAVSEGYRHFGLIFWQMVLGVLVMGGILVLRGRRLPLSPAALRLYVIIALIGTVLPNAASFQAAVHLPAGVLALSLSMVPLFGFPIALALGTENFEPRRLAGLGLGLAGVALLVLPGTGGLPEAALPWLGVALLAALSYALEGNVVARWGTAGLDPVQTLCGAYAVGAALSLPLALGTGHWIAPRLPWDWGAPERALALLGTINPLIYATYVWLIGRAGAVFAQASSYLVTGFGLIWSMVILGERYASGMWLALALIFAGLMLVSPRRNRPLPAAAPRTKLPGT